MDLDGDTDIVVAQMHTTSAKKILILFNADGMGQAGKSRKWTTPGCTMVSWLTSKMMGILTFMAQTGQAIRR